ncbi:MAG: rhodanese-like domain-containing protein [Candidatus Anstonellales archaeon]
MNSKILLLALALISISFLISTSFSKSDLIQPDELKDWVIRGKEFVLVDIRDDYNYSLSHIKGAINIPVLNMSDEDIVRAFREIRENYPDREIVIYCYRGKLAARISELLANNSIYVKRLPVGWLDIADEFREVSAIE